MSVEMVNHFLETPEYGKADPTGLLVLLYLAWRHTESQGCFPSLTTMEQHLHRPKASIWKAKKKLVQQGLLVVAHRGKGLAYTFPLYVHASTDAPRANAEDVKGSDRGVGTVQTGGVTDSDWGVGTVQTGGVTSSDRYINDNNKEKDRKECMNASASTRTGSISCVDSGDSAERPSCVPSDGEAQAMARQIGVPETYLPKFFATMKSKGWGYVNRGGVQVNLNRSNFKSILGAFYGRENERSAKDTSLHTGHYELRLGKKKEESI